MKTHSKKEGYKTCKQKKHKEGIRKVVRGFLFSATSSVQYNHCIGEKRAAEA
jgi:hypothetical protein